MVYTIGEMAKLLGVAPSTLRYYDKEGLLPFMERSEGGIRVFQDKDFEFLQIIHCLKAAGMQIKDIRKFIALVMQGDETIEARLALFQKRKKEVENQIVELQETLDTIRFKCWYYETAKKYGGTAVPDNMKDEELPEDLRAIRKKLRGR
ncbi:MAG: MerR family transcriptional regulator [Acutalibacteraceae bacterium]|nr:MerR family transcriptional regulator [Acutalibacteraceae bacterium]HIR03066.1 MerR family transcriptional regulator [Candidatus Scatovicinus merdipullorum]